MGKRLHHDRKLTLPFFYMTTLFLLSSVRGDITEEDLAGMAYQWINPNWQNLLHVPLYGGLAACWLWALKERQISNTSWLALTLILTSAWAVLDETHQMYVPGRSASFTDIALNVLGALLTVGVARFYLQTFRPGA